MSKTGIVVLSIFGAVALLVLSLVVAVIGYYNSAVNFENSIDASDKNMQNILGQQAPKLREMLGVRKLQADDVARVIREANESRYGDGGSQAVMNWIREQNPTLDQKGYDRILNVIEATRNNFNHEQTLKIDKVQQYKNATQRFPGNIIYGFLGKPTPGFMEKHERVIQSSHTRETFETGIDDGIDVTGKK